MKTTSKLMVVILVMSLLGAMVVPAMAQGMSGAIYTTDSTCSGVNVNIFDSKDDVYLNGGPQGGGSGLPDGWYYAKVTEPDGTMLGKSTAAVIEVIAGSFAGCYQLSSILFTASSDFMMPGYDTTSNAGGVYKVWVSMDPDFPADASKTDNFKVRDDVQQQYGLQVLKFYDANANGAYDVGEVYIDGWKVNIADVYGIFNQDAYTPVDLLLDAGDYTVAEYMPVQTNWMATTPTWVSVTLPPPTTVEFGNLCLGAGGGHTLGFWSNRNGQALIDAGDLAMLVALNLRNADGTDFDPASKTAFRSWLLGANATNMAYMLSAQLAAMALNVYNDFVDGNALIYAPGTTSANALGFATVNAVMAEADAELGLHGAAYAGDSWRSYQEALKNALDNANNNYTFVQPEPCMFSFE